MRRTLALAPFVFLFPCALAQVLPPRAYDVVYVRAPRHGDLVNSFWPDAITPLVVEPGADLMLLHPNGSEEVLFSAGAKGAVIDPYVSYDATRVLFAYFPDATDVNPQRGLNSELALSYQGADVYEIHLGTRQVTRLTFQEFTPNTGNGADFNCAQPYTNCPRVGVFNTGPAYLPDGRIVFTSTRNNLLPNKMTSGAQRVMQLFVMDGDGKNVTNIGYLNGASAMHPYVLKDGRVAFTSWENMGVRDDRDFPLWTIWPDGTRFEPFSGFGTTALAHHFMTQLSDGSIVVTLYYNLNNNGFGELYRFPVNGTGNPQDPLFAPIPPDTDSIYSIPLERVGFTRTTPYTSSADMPSPCDPGDPPYPPVPCSGGNGTRVGKLTHPSAAGPAGEMLVVYTPGAANHNGIFVGAGLATPFYDGGIYRVRGDQVQANEQGLELVKNDPAWNEQWPRAVVPYQAVYGVPAPQILPRLANDGTLDARLAEGTPYGLIGTSSLIWRDTRPFRGDRFYPHENFGDRSWITQGADAGLYTDDDVYAIRILALSAITDRTYPNNGRGFDSLYRERVRILGEIPVRKEGTVDGNGHADTSFLARIPGDVHFTFQTLDRSGLVLNMAQTWHQVRPGEKRNDCGGCHAHAKTPLDFRTTVAAQPSHAAADMALVTPLLNVDGSQSPGVTTVASHSVTYEYTRDVAPILKTKCASCHTSVGRSPAAGLDLDRDHLDVDGYPGTYAFLTQRRTAQNPTPEAITPDGTWWGPQATRYIRAGQSRQSLLAWKIFGRRLDGRANADRPTETVPGDPGTIPGGADFSDCDLDYLGEAMPPPSSGITLTWAERMTIARWIDLGCPIDLPGSNTFAGFFEDDTRPTLTLVPLEEAAQAAGKLTRFVIGAYDLESGLDASTLSLTLNVAAGGSPPGTNLAAGLSVSEGVPLSIPLPAPVSLSSGNVVARLSIRDHAGHLTEIVRTYRQSAGTCIGSAPAVTPPADLEVVQSTCDGTTPVASPDLTSFLAAGSGSSACPLTRLPPQLQGVDITPWTLFPPGPNPVAFRYGDPAGQVGSASATVNVRRIGDLNLDHAVDVQDVVILAGYLVGNVAAGAPPFLAPASRADTDGNTVLDIFDLVRQANYIVGNVACLLP